MVRIVLLVVAVVCFALAALKVPAMIDFENAGYAFTVASFLA